MRNSWRAQLPPRALLIAPAQVIIDRIATNVEKLNEVIGNINTTMTVCHVLSREFSLCALFTSRPSSSSCARWESPRVRESCALLETALRCRRRRLLQFRQ